MTAANDSISQETPRAWNNSDAVSVFFDQLAVTDHAVLMLDYDGTLAPFTEKRLEAVPYPGVRERLDKLLSLDDCRLVLISGRKAHELQSLIALHRPVEIWGSHGREHLEANGNYSIEPLKQEEQTALDTVRQALENAYEPSVLECKPNSVAVHWRGVKERTVEMEQTVRVIFAKYAMSQNQPTTLQLLRFDGGLEVRAGDVNKGDAVGKVLAGLPNSTPVAFLGDDLTDEDAFRALGNGQLSCESLSILVRKEARASLAQAWLQPPEELLEFLDRWIDARESHTRESRKDASGDATEAYKP